MALQKVKATADFFTNDDGSEFHYVGCSEFADWKRFNLENGPEALVRPNLIERKLIREAAGYHGPIVNRVFRYSDPGNPFGALPTDTEFSKINSFLDLCAEYGVYVDWTCGDSQKPYMLPNVNDQQNWLNDFCANTTRFCFMETCNEPFKNGELPQHGVIPPVSGWYLRDSGYYAFIGTEVWDTRYNLDFVSFHGTRDNNPPRWPKWACDLDDSLATLRSALGKPSVLKEPAKFGSNYFDAAVARMLGLRAQLGGVTFHNQKGLEGNGFDNETRVAYGEYFRGVVGSI